MNLQQYPEWEPTITELAASGGTVVIIGGTDAGKTTFCTLLVNATAEVGKRAAIVDGDIGQSEIGPPACVGLGLVDTPVRTLSEITPAGLAFVGATAPRGNLLEHATAIRVLADRAREANPELLVVDTTGFLQGPSAQRLKQAKFALLTPRHVVAIQRKGECDAILAPLRDRTDITVHRLAIPDVIKVKSPAFRAQRRMGKFARYFEDAALQTYGFDDITMTGTWLNQAPSIAPHLLKFLSSTLNARVYHAEEYHRHIGIVTNTLPVMDTRLTTIQEQFRAQAITVTPASRMRHLLVGMGDGSGKLLGLGLIEALDFRRRQIGLLTPIRAPGAVRVLQFGLLRIESTGKEIGTNRPGEV